MGCPQKDDDDNPEETGNTADGFQRIRRTQRADIMPPGNGAVRLGLSRGDDLYLLRGRVDERVTSWTLLYTDVRRKGMSV